MNELLIQISGHLVELLSIALTALIGWIGKQLADYIKTKTKNSAIDGITTRINSAVWTVVSEVQETMAKEYKKKASDGKLTEEEKKELKEHAMKKLKAFLSLEEIKRVFNLPDLGIVEDILSAKVETAVKEIKEKGSSVNP